MSSPSPAPSLTANAVLAYQGAEARVFHCDFLGLPAVLKERFVKSYRHPALDTKLTAARLAAESRTLVKCRKAGLHTPALYFVDAERRLLCLERIEGETVREIIHTGVLKHREAELMREIGLMVAKIHEAGVCHGDLTTSNMLLRHHPSLLDSASTAPLNLSVIDFGLSSNSALIEDRAVDLYVLERAFLSSHPASETSFALILNAYVGSHSAGSKVLARLCAVRQRGRKRAMVG